MGTSHSTARFYVYVLARPNGKPFYVGKGKGDRVFNHDTEARSGHKCHKCNVIRKIWRQGGQVLRYIVFETNNEEEAYAYEQELIAMYNRTTLVNLTDGGDGMRGMTEEIRRKISEKAKARMADPGFRQRFLDQMRDVHQTETHRKGQRDRANAQWADPGRRARRAEQTRQQMQDPARVERVREASRRLWQDPEYRARVVAAQRAGRARKRQVTHDQEEGKR